jgi:hypothetical protein
MPSKPRSVLCPGGLIVGLRRLAMFAACGDISGGGKIEVCFGVCLRGGLEFIAKQASFNPIQISQISLIKAQIQPRLLMPFVGDPI